MTSAAIFYHHWRGRCSSDHRRFLSEPGSARYSSTSSLTTVWSNYQTLFNDFFEVYITKTVSLSPNVQTVLWPLENVHLVGNLNTTKIFFNTTWTTAWTEMDGRTAYRQPMTVFWSRAQQHVSTSLMKWNVATNLGTIFRLC